MQSCRNNLGADGQAMGPRHLCFHPSGKWAYYANEMAGTLSDGRFGARHTMNVMQNTAWHLLWYTMEVRPTRRGPQPALRHTSGLHA